ncbi:hypothetical protein CERSUDRAFT_104910 [Gelatoporia subvermispora B]|uniref:Uncharacterized protein n=1 Tax=Ceriporiopsis subvermispora (strain B) TaxID=914234 RepID=M2RHM4_CERS8|nr:hypothetical protein CERSUDRAFT_104910 [Gelatoporia subvermispora B]
MDKEKALEMLRAFSETCTASIAALRQPQSTAPSPPCAVLHKDFLSLLTLVYTSTTKLTLTLRPSEPSYTAAVGPLRDLLQHVSSLTTCATLFDAHGATLSTEVKTVARQVIDSLHSLSENFVNQGGEGYLVATGTVHDVVSQAQQSLSTDNVSAVKKRWAADRGMLDDVLSEVADMLENGAPDEEEDEDEDDFDDEWDELGLGAKKKMSDTELARTKKVQPLLRFTTMLHKRVLLDAFPWFSSQSPAISNLTLDPLPALSHDLLVNSEELAASLYAPQDLSNVTSSVTSLADAVAKLQSALLDSSMLPPPRPTSVEALVEGVSSMRVSSDGASEKPKAQAKDRDIRGWFDTCFAQIDRLSKSLVEILASDSANGT